MKVYHGSYMKITNIDLSVGKANRDFGQGFYVTKIEKQASAWAKRKGEDNNTQGIITEFEFDEYIWQDAEFKNIRFSTYTSEWLDFVVNNRSNRSGKQIHDYDLIEGPVADDAITVRINNYLRGEITKERFLSELTFTKPTHQICLCTVASLQALEYPENKLEWKIEHIGNEIVRRIVSDFQKDDIEAADLFYNSTTFAQLVDESTGLYKKSWNEIYEMLIREISK
jgi:hypothetical protein